MAVQTGALSKYVRHANPVLGAAINAKGMYAVISARRMS